jgi:hypothetical protein
MYTYCEPLHRLPEVHLLLFENGVVLAELVLSLVQTVQDRVDVTGRLVTIVIAQLSPNG